MYSEINPPPQRPSMSATKYDDSWYYSERKIALLDARYDRTQTTMNQRFVASTQHSTPLVRLVHSN